VGCPIRTSEDHRALAPPLGFSQRATSFIASRYQGIHQMPFSCCARAQPRARASGSSSPQGGSPKTRACRGQMSEVRRQRVRPPGRRVAFPISDLRSLTFGTVAQTAAPADARASAARIPMLQARPRPRGAGRTCFTVTTRFTISTEQRVKDRRQTTRSAAPHPPPQLAVPDARRRAQRLSVL
jgi:hypothetical protein